MDMAYNLTSYYNAYNKPQLYTHGRFLSELTSYYGLNNHNMNDFQMAQL